MAEKRHDSRWVAPLLASFHAIPASFDATGWSSGQAGALRSVEVLSSVGEVIGEGRSGGGRKKREKGFREREMGEEREKL